MSDQDFTSQPANGVSPLRKKLSAILLLALLVVLAVELRAGIGQMLAGKSLQAAAPDGVFEYDKVSRESILSMFSLAPAETLVRENTEELEYEYKWFSLLRPVLSRPEAAFYVVYRNQEPLTAVRHGTEPPGKIELEMAAQAAESPVDSTSDDGGMMPGPGDEPRPSVGNSDGQEQRRRPPVDDDTDPSAEPDKDASAKDQTANEAADGASENEKRPPAEPEAEGPSETEEKPEADTKSE